MTVETDTIEALDGEYRTAREIANKMGCWAQMTIRKSLEELVRVQIAERRIDRTTSGTIHRYRRTKVQ